MFANKIGMWKPKDPKQLELMGNMTEGSWLAEICFTLTENLVRLSNLASAPETPAVRFDNQKNEQQARANKASHNCTDSLAFMCACARACSSPQVAVARASAFRAVVRNACDLPVACHFLKLGPFATHPHGHFGVLGAVSSSISLYEMWPTIMVGVVKQA